MYHVRDSRRRPSQGVLHQRVDLQQGTRNVTTRLLCKINNIIDNIELPGEGKDLAKQEPAGATTGCPPTVKLWPFFPPHAPIALGPAGRCPAGPKSGPSQKGFSLELQHS